jgi:hypothetical protein
VSPIQSLRVHAIDVSHETRQVRLVRAQYEMAVIARQTVGQRPRIEAIQRIGQNPQMHCTVGIVDADSPSPGNKI